jgi:GGDEF domain-containing protein
MLWIPLVFNLHNCKLVSFVNPEQQKAQSKVIEPPIPDKMLLDKAKRNLARIESGLMSYELFFHFLQMEFERCKRNNAHFFSLLIFSIHNAKTQEPLSFISIAKLTEIIEGAKAELDLLGHYRENDFIMLCPNRDPQQAAALAVQLTNALKNSPQTEASLKDLKLAFGIAGVPHNAKSLTDLLRHAETAKDNVMRGSDLLSLSDAKPA